MSKNTKYTFQPDDALEFEHKGKRYKRVATHNINGKFTHDIRCVETDKKYNDVEDYKIIIK